jgi:hypothetical protein
MADELDVSDEQADAAEEAAAVQLEDEDPVDVDELDEAGEEPPASWGQDGTGDDKLEVG